jgi:hypothetical protein
VAEETLKGRTEENRRWKSSECNNGIRDRDIKQQLPGSKRIKDLGDRRSLCSRKEITTTNEIDGWISGQNSHMGTGGTRKKTLYEVFRGKIE